MMHQNRTVNRITIRCALVGGTERDNCCATARTQCSGSAGSVFCAMARKGHPKPPEMQQALDAVSGIPAFAQLLQVSPQRVRRWRTIPAEYAIVIEAKIGLPRERVRPDRTITRRGG
jgi:hypothetical protein